MGTARWEGHLEWALELAPEPELDLETTITAAAVQLHPSGTYQHVTGVDYERIDVINGCQHVRVAKRRYVDWRRPFSSAVIAVCLCPTLWFPGPCCFKLNAEFFARAYDV